MQWRNFARRAGAWSAIPRQAIRDVRIHRAAQGYGLGPLPLRIVEQVALLAVCGVNAENYYQNGLANIVRGFARKSRFLGDFEQWRWAALMNPMRPTTHNKLMFHAHLVEHGLPAPKLYAYIAEGSKPGAVTPPPPPQVLIGTCVFSLEEFLAWLKRERVENFLAKPVQSTMGQGVLCVGDLADDSPRWHEVPSGRLIGLPEIEAAIRKFAKDFIVQERLRPHGDLSCFSSTVLQTARIVTTRVDDAVHVVGATFKIANGGHAVDNLIEGGNAVAAVDLRTGTLGPGFMMKNGLVPYESDIHPVTNARISGTVLPCWGEAIDTAVMIAQTFPAPQYIGWDIGLTTRGVVVIEGNARPDPMLLQLPHGKGLLEDTTVQQLLRESGRFHGHVPARCERQR
jgi:hypothetical protein